MTNDLIVEADLGPIAKRDGVLVIPVPGLLAGGAILVRPSAQAPSWSQEDEAEMDSIICSAVARDDQAIVYWSAQQGGVNMSRIFTIAF